MFKKKIFFFKQLFHLLTIREMVCFDNFLAQVLHVIKLGYTTPQSMCLYSQNCERSNGNRHSNQRTGLLHVEQQLLKSSHTKPAAINEKKRVCHKPRVYVFVKFSNAYLISPYSQKMFSRSLTEQRKKTPNPSKNS